MRYAKYQLSLEDQERLNSGNPIQLTTFGGFQPKVYVKSLKNTNKAGFDDHLFEMRVGEYRIILSASEMTQVMQSV